MKTLRDEIDHGTVNLSFADLTLVSSTGRKIKLRQNWLQVITLLPIEGEDINSIRAYFFQNGCPREVVDTMLLMDFSLLKAQVTTTGQARLLIKEFGAKIMDWVSIKFVDSGRWSNRRLSYIFVQEKPHEV
jgi:hypothetical protein